MNLWIDITPIPKGRPRMGRGHAYTPAATRQFESNCQMLMRSAMNRGNHKMFVEGPLWCSITFHLPRPKKPKYDRPAVKPDATNLVKSVEDAANGILWTDDAQVCHLVIDKRYVSDSPGASNKPGIEIQVEPL